jgi:peptide/nickel transport system substrate-binding protein
MNEQRSYWRRLARGRMSRRRLLTGAAAGLGTLAAYLAACGGGAKTEQGKQGSAPGAAAPPAVPAYGGRLQVAYGLEPSSLDPHIGNSGGDRFSYAPMFDTLVGIDERGTARPDLSLAERWEVVDPTTIVFRLRPGVKFHDGSPFDAETVRWNIERVKDPDLKSTARASFLNVDRVETLDPLTARFVLKEPSAAVLSDLGGRGGTMIPRGAAEKLGKEFGSKPVGTGPFQFVQWAPGSHVTVKRNPSYWRKDAAGNQLPYLDEVTVRIIPDQTVQFANLVTGEVHLAGLVAKDLPAAEGNPDLTVIKREAAGVGSVLVFNLDLSPLSNVNLRRAVVAAIDPAAINQAVHFGRWVVAEGGLWTPASWAYVPAANKPKYDPTKAKEHLRAGGAPDGFAFTLLTYSNPILQQQTEIMQGQLAKVGIKATIEQKDVGAATNAFFVERQFPLYSTSWGISGAGQEPDGICTSNYTASGFYNPMKRPISPEMEDLIKKGRQTYDPEERKKIYARINEIVFDQVFFVPLLYSSLWAGLRKPLQGGENLFGGAFTWRYDFLWLKR